MEDTAWGLPGRPQGLGVGFASEDWGLVGSPGVLVGPTGTTALIKKKKKSGPWDRVANEKGNCSWTLREPPLGRTGEGSEQGIWKGGRRCPGNHWAARALEEGGDELGGGSRTRGDAAPRACVLTCVLWFSRSRAQVPPRDGTLR